jgi:hypothetical protein
MENQTKLCPICWNENETNKHFLTCNWHQQQEKSNEFMCNLALNNGKWEIERTLYNTINRVLMQKTPEIPNKYANIEKQQEDIGWDQFRIGRMTKAWSLEYEKETGNETGHSWMGNIIKKVWMYHHQRWYTRCQLMQEENNTKTTTNNNIINNEISLLYGQFDRLDEVDKQLLSMPMDKRTEMKTTTKIAWVKHTRNLIKTGIRRNSDRVKLNNHSILDFFTQKKRVTRDVEQEGPQDRVETRINKKRRKSKDENTNKIRKENMKQH